MKRNIKLRLSIALLSIAVTILCGCKKMIEVDPPSSSINSENVFNNDPTAIGVMTGIYAQLSNGNATPNGLDGLSNLSLSGGLLSDELTLYDLNDLSLPQYYRNELTQAAAPATWTYAYGFIYTCNAALEGLKNRNSLTLSVKQELIGEAQFMRAFCYFYLVNLYGDVPMPLTTDVKVNAVLARSPKSDVYAQMVKDLLSAESLLNTEFVDVKLNAETTERVRPNKWTAAALLARVYFYQGNYQEAEKQSSLLIDNNSRFALTSLPDVFLKNSQETIWALQPVNDSSQPNTGEGGDFILSSSGFDGYRKVYLSDDLYKAFEPGDQRKLKWIDTITIKDKIYPFAYKYHNGWDNAGSLDEYIMMFRLGEQYLIRAESRARQGNIAGAQFDLNALRARAGLSPTMAVTADALIAAIAKERRVELFTEFGDRWFDLKRTGKLDSVMNVAEPKKGSQWSPNWALFPIPLSDLQKDYNLTGNQNPGY